MLIQFFMTGKKFIIFTLCISLIIYLTCLGFKDEISEKSTKINITSTSTATKSNWPVPNDKFIHLQWFVQLSDLHISIFRDETRIKDLLHFCQEVLPIIKAQVILVTGDITDSKLENHEGSTQLEMEWKEYFKIQNECKQFGNTVWLDTRGNHDSFDVAHLKSPNNFYSKYSVRGKGGQLSYLYRHQMSDNYSVSFIAVDACPDPGPRRPFNFFGVIKKSQFIKLKRLTEEASKTSNVTIFFGHYPTSIISEPSSNHVRQVLGSGLAYVCGHLHTMAGLMPDMYAMQKTGYLELELADWKDSRHFRTIVLDHGLFSFVDTKSSLWPIIIISNPKDHRFASSDKEPLENMITSTHIRLLIFTTGKIEEIKLWVDGDNIDGVIYVEGPLYVAPWKAQLYSSGVHLIKAIVKDSLGNKNMVEQSFSLDGSRPIFSSLRRYMLLSDHTFFFKVIFVFFFILSTLPLVVIRIVHIHLRISVKHSISCSLLRFSQTWLRRYYLLCSATKIYLPLLLYNFYLIIGPWFIGEMLEGQYGFCFLYGLYINGHFIPASLTYLYGSLQIIYFNIPLTLYLAKTLDLSLIRTNKNNQSMVETCCWCVVTRPIRFFLYHILFFAIVLFQMYLVLFGFFMSYGTIALLLCPLRTWAVVMALYLFFQANNNNDQMRSTFNLFNLLTNGQWQNTIVGIGQEVLQESTNRDRLQLSPRGSEENIPSNSGNFKVIEKISNFSLIRNQTEHKGVVRSFLNHLVNHDGLLTSRNSKHLQSHNDQQPYRYPDSDISATRIQNQKDMD